MEISSNEFLSITYKYLKKNTIHELVKNITKINEMSNVGCGCQCQMSIGKKINYLGNF